MPANKPASRPGASRPKGAAAPPAQQRRRREAVARAKGAPVRPTQKSAEPLLSRDKLLGWGTAACALLTVAGLSLSGVVLLVGLGYMAFALLGAPDKRDPRLRQASWAFAMLLTAAVIVVVVLTVQLAGETPDSEGSFVYLSMGAASAVLNIASQAALALAAVLAALAFGTSGRKRHRHLGWWGVCLVFYYILFLPEAVVRSQAPPALGSVWAAPLTYGSAALGLFAGAVVAGAFLWTGGIGRAKREYLLFVSAASWLLARLMSLLLFDWGGLAAAPDQPLTEAAAGGFFVVVFLLQLPVLFCFAAAAFWLSCRREGWSLRAWATGPAESPVESPAESPVRQSPFVEPHQAGSTSADPAVLSDIDIQTPVPLLWAQRFLLTWRLPLAYSWFIVLIAACSFLGWYGFIAVAPAALHYVWTLMWARGRARNARVGAGGT